MIELLEAEAILVDDRFPGLELSDLAHAIVQSTNCVQSMTNNPITDTSDVLEILNPETSVLLHSALEVFLVSLPLSTPHPWIREILIQDSYDY